MAQLLFARTGLRRARISAAAAAGALLLTAALTGCNRGSPTAAAPTATSPAPAASGGIAGVVPQSESTLPASDRPTAPATGALEAGQAGSRGNSGIPAPTAGDGAASAAAPGASR